MSLPICPAPALASDPAFLRTLAGDGLATLVQQHLAIGAQLLALAPDYVRWKDQDGSLLGFRATLRTTGEDGPTTSYVTVRTAPAHRLADEAERLRHRAEEEQDGLRAFAFLPGERLLLLGFPMDRAMHDLRRLVRASKVRGLLANTCPNWQPADERFSKSRSRMRLVRYKPERRAVLQWLVGGVDAQGRATAPRPIWLRCHAEAQATRARVATEAAAAAGVRCPATLGIAHERLSIEAHVPGTVWTPSDHDGEWAIEAVAATLSRLHAATVPGAGLGRLPVHGTLAELDLVLRAAEDLARLDPGLGRLAHRIGDELTRQVPANGALALAHGDLHPEQVLLDGPAVGFVDFDRACLAPAAHDLATLRAHAIAHGGEPGERVARAVTTAYARHRALPDAAELAWWNACALLRTATGPFRRLDRDWPARTAALLAAASTALPAVEERR